MPAWRWVVVAADRERDGFDCGGGCALAVMSWQVVLEVPTSYGCNIHQGLGISRGTFHCACSG